MPAPKDGDRLFGMERTERPLDRGKRPTWLERGRMGREHGVGWTQGDRLQGVGSALARLWPDSPPRPAASGLISAVS